MKKLLISVLSMSVLLGACGKDDFHHKEKHRDHKNLKENNLSKEIDKLNIYNFEKYTEVITADIEIESPKKNDTDVAGFDYKENTSDLYFKNVRYLDDDNKIKTIDGSMKETYFINSVKNDNLKGLKNGDTVTFIQVTDDRKDNSSKNKKFTEFKDADVYLSSITKLDLDEHTDSQFDINLQSYPTSVEEVTYYIYKTDDYKKIKDKLKKQIILLKENYVKKYKK